MTSSVSAGNSGKNSNGRKRHKQLFFNFGSDEVGKKANRAARVHALSELRTKIVKNGFKGTHGVVDFRYEMRSKPNAKMLHDLRVDYQAFANKVPSANVPEFIRWLERKRSDVERAASAALRVADSREQAEGYAKTAEFISRYISYLKATKMSP